MLRCRAPSKCCSCNVFALSRSYVRKSVDKCTCCTLPAIRSNCPCQGLGMSNLHRRDARHSTLGHSFQGICVCGTYLPDRNIYGSRSPCNYDRHTKYPQHCLDADSLAGSTSWGMFLPCLCTFQDRPPLCKWSFCTQVTLKTSSRHTQLALPNHYTLHF